MRFKVLLAGSILCGVVCVALVLTQALSAPPMSLPATRPAIAITTANDEGSGSLRSTLRSARMNSTITLPGGRIINKSDLILNVPGLALLGRPATRSQIGGRQTVVTANGVTLRDLEFFGEPDINGRSLLIIGSKKTVSDAVVENVVVHSGGTTARAAGASFATSPSVIAASRATPTTPVRRGSFWGRTRARRNPTSAPIRATPPPSFAAGLRAATAIPGAAEGSMCFAIAKST